MNELEQLRAQVIELVMDNGRLREGLEFIQENSATRGPRRKAEELLSQPTPTNAGAQVLALVRAAVKRDGLAAKALAAVSYRGPESDADAFYEADDDLNEAIEALTPELRQWLGVV